MTNKKLHGKDSKHPACSIVSIPLSMSHIYLIPCQGGYLQVDTGYEHDYPLYRRNLAKAGIPIESIRYLLLTHHHDDHVGFLNEFTRDTDLTIIAHGQAASLLQSGRNDKTRGGGYVNNFIKLVAGLKMHFDPRWTLTFPPFTLRRKDILLTGDDTTVLRHLGIPGTILYTPGHCIDHVSMILDTGETFCGDAAASFLLWAGTRYCTVFMTDMEEAYRSWDKMLNSGAQMIYPAHGRPFPANKLWESRGRIKSKSLATFF
jgi:glyoxylase-like metal-dependent hydrolase (beta-lactamase superfamily II)